MSYSPWGRKRVGHDLAGHDLATKQQQQQKASEEPAETQVQFRVPLTEVPSFFKALKCHLASLGLAGNAPTIASSAQG